MAETSDLFGRSKSDFVAYASVSSCRQFEDLDTSQKAPNEAKREVGVGCIPPCILASYP